MPDFLHHYQEELRYLSDAGKSFATAFPEVAHYLNMSAHEDRDPYVEKLFEGFSFLTARIQEKIHDDFPEVTRNVMEMIAPDFLRPFPSVAMMTFSSPKGMLPSSVSVPKGTVVLSNPKNGVPKPCKFQTTSTINLHPFVLKQTQLIHDQVYGIQIELHFEIEETVEAADLSIAYLDIYLDGNPDAAWLLYYFFYNSLGSVTLKYGNTSIDLGKKSIVNPGLEMSTKVLPEESAVLSKAHLMREFFAYPEKFRYIRITDLNHITHMGDNKRFSLTFRFSDLLPDEANRIIQQDTFKLFCTPAVNVFEHKTEPVQLNHKHFEYLVTPSLQEPLEVFCIKKVEGKGKAAQEVAREYLPYNKFRQVVASNNDAAYGFYYSVKLEEKKGGGKNTLLSIGSVGDISFYKDEFLNLETLCTNGLVPREKILEKDICNPVPGFPDYIKFTNPLRPTAPIPAEQSKHYLWKVLGHMGMTLSVIATKENLRAIFEMYSKGANPGQKKYIESLIDVREKHESFFVDGVINRGTLIEVDFYDDRVKHDSYGHLANYHLLGTILHTYLTHFCPAHYVVSLKFAVKSAGVNFSWKPKRSICHSI